MYLITFFTRNFFIWWSVILLAILFEKAWNCDSLGLCLLGFFPSNPRFCRQTIYSVCYMVREVVTYFSHDLIHSRWCCPKLKNFRSMGRKACTSERTVRLCQPWDVACLQHRSFWSTPLFFQSTNGTVIGPHYDLLGRWMLQGPGTSSEDGKPICTRSMRNDSFPWENLDWIAFCSTAWSFEMQPVEVHLKACTGTCQPLAFIIKQIVESKKSIFQKINVPFLLNKKKLSKRKDAEEKLARWFINNERMAYEA